MVSWEAIKIGSELSKFLEASTSAFNLVGKVVRRHTNFS